MDQLPLVSVGMPVYNRPKSLECALDSIRAQTYHNLEIIVSDNASPNPQVTKVIKKASNEDWRIRHFSQNSNIGAAENFLFVLRQARGEFFMWAADDDEWDPAFIEKLLTPLLRYPNIGLSFCDFDVRYPDGSLCNDYGSFALAYRDFLQVSNVSRVAHYALQAPERGKANLIYGLFRRGSLIETSVARHFNSSAWGSDMLMVCDVLSRWPFYLVDEKLYTVGITDTTNDSSDGCSEIESQSQWRWRLKLMVSHLNYFFVYVRIMARTPNSNPISLMSFILRLMPLIVRWMKNDLT